MSNIIQVKNLLTDYVEATHYDNKAFIFLSEKIIHIIMVYNK